MLKHSLVHFFAGIATVVSAYALLFSINIIFFVFGYDVSFLKGIVGGEFIKDSFYQEWWTYLQSLNLSSINEVIIPFLIVAFLFYPVRKVYSFYYCVLDRKLSLSTVRDNIKNRLKETHIKVHSSEKINLSNFLLIGKDDFNKIFCLSQSEFFINPFNKNNLNDSLEKKFTIIHGRPFSGKTTFIAYLINLINDSSEYIALYIDKEGYKNFDISKYEKSFLNFNRVYLFFDLNLGCNDDFQVVDYIYKKISIVHKNTFVFISSYESVLDKKICNLSMKLEDAEISVIYSDIINQHFEDPHVRYLSSDTLNKTVGGSKHYASILPALIATCAQWNGVEWSTKETLPKSDAHLQLILIQLFDIVVPVDIAEKLFPISGLIEKASKRSCNLCIRPMNDEKWYGVGYIAPIFAYRAFIDNYATIGSEDFSTQYGAIIDRAIVLYKEKNDPNVLDFIRLLIHNLGKDRNFILEGIDPSQHIISLSERHIDYLYEQVSISGDPSTKIRWAGTFANIKQSNKPFCLSNATELLTMNARAKDAILNEPRLFIMAKVALDTAIKNCLLSEKDSILKLATSFLTMFTLKELIESDYSFNKHADFIRRVSSTISSYTDLWSMIIQKEGRTSQYQGRVKKELQQLLASDKEYISNTVESIIELHIARMTANTEWEIAKQKYIHLINKQGLSVDFPQLRLKIILELFGNTKARKDYNIYGFELWEIALEEYELNIQHLGRRDKDRFNEELARYVMIHGHSFNDDQIHKICTIIQRMCANHGSKGYGLHDIFDPIFYLMALNAKYPIEKTNDFYQSKFFQKISEIAKDNYCNAGLSDQYQRIMWSL